MKRGPDGLRQHVLFVPGRQTGDAAAIRETLDEVEAWLKSTYEESAYIYHRFAVTTSVFFHNVDDVMLVKLRWHGIMLME